MNACPARLLAITALVLGVACGSGTERPAGTDSGAASDSGRASLSAVEDYLRFASAAGGTTAAVDDAHTAEGLRKLAGALGTLGVGPSTLQVDLRVAAEHILLNPSSPETTAIVRDGLVSAAEAIQSAASGGDSLTPLAQAVKAGVPVPDQRATLNRFFLESARALEQISRRS